jgi:hypothetical protein
MQVRPSAFIVSPAYDVTFFFASLAAPLLLWGAFGLGWLTGVAVYAVFQLAFNLPHNAQTWTMSIFDDEDRSKNGRRYAIALGIILVVFAVPALLSPEGVAPWLRDALVYWGYYHLVRQHYGILRLYERRMANAGTPAPPLESKLYARFIDVVSYAPLLIRFRDPNLMTIHAAGRAVWIRHPILPPIVWQAVASAYAATILLAVVHHVVLALTGRRNLGPRAMHLIAVTVCFGLATLVVNDILVAIAIVTAFHNLQYMGLVWFHNRTRADIADREHAPAGKNVTIDWIRTGKQGRYAALSFAYGAALLAPVAIFRTPLSQLPITCVVALHYYVDSRVWRFADHPNLARFLRLKA